MPDSSTTAIASEEIAGRHNWGPEFVEHVQDMRRAVRRCTDA